jgi:hypothetical protein
MQANKGRGVVGSKKCYDAELVKQWRKIKRDELLTYPELAIRSGVSENTLYKAFQEF